MNVNEHILEHTFPLYNLPYVTHNEAYFRAKCIISSHSNLCPIIFFELLYHCNIFSES